jgi:hypothetical protein
MGIIIFSTSAYAQTPSEFSYRLVPNKILQNSEGVIQVSNKGDNMPTGIENLVATSSDSSIIKITSIENDKNNFVTNIKIQTLNSGDAKIALAAPGFLSQEFPITVYSNNNVPTKLIIKSTPNKFSTKGIKNGYLSIELVNNGGIPTRTINDMPIALSTTDSNIIHLKNTMPVIQKGQYFVTGEFEILKDGNVQITASAQSMQPVSTAVSVSTATTPQTIQLFIYPTNINDYSNSNAYAIVQLHDSGGKLVQAQNDIPISVAITDTSLTNQTNVSSQTPLMSSNEQLVIKKGSYWGYSKLTVNAGTKDTFSLSIAAKGYVVSSPVTVTPKPGTLYDTNSAKLDMLPILATGQEELVGVLHLEDNKGNPVIPSKDFQTEVDSSDPNTLSIKNIQMNQGVDAALVFGNVGSTISSGITLNVLTQNVQTVSPTITLPTPNSLTLAADPLITKAFSHDDYPLAVYMLDSTGTATFFPQDLNVFISPNDYIQIGSATLSKGQSVILLDTNSLKDTPASTNVLLTAGDFQTNIPINNISSKPTTVFINYPDKILSNIGNTFSIQLLDLQQFPVIADHDMKFKIVSSNPDILNVPESVVIKKGDYYSLFNVDAKKTGTSEIAFLSDEFPLVKYNIDVTSLTPQVSISSSDYVDQNAVLGATLNAQYQGSSLNGMKVEWNVKGATIQSIDSVTDKDGNAKISLLSQDPKTISIDVSMSGGAFATTTVSKTISVNQPLGPPTASNTTPGTTALSLFGINPMFIIIPVAAAAAGGIIILKKKNMLDGITEKISIMEKVSEIKERITQLREK